MPKKDRKALKKKNYRFQVLIPYLQHLPLCSSRMELWYVYFFKLFLTMVKYL